MPECNYSMRIKVVGDGCAICNPKLNLEIITKRMEEAEEKLDKIEQWCNAYPLDVFPEPDFKKAAQVLKENGMTIDSISASNIRHALKGVKVVIGKDEKYASQTKIKLQELTEEQEQLLKAFEIEKSQQTTNQEQQDIKLKIRFALYQRTINSIDDFFKYRYKNMDRHNIKKMVGEILEDLTNKLKLTK